MLELKAETLLTASSFYFFFSFLNKHFITNKSTGVIYLANSLLCKFMQSKALKKVPELDKDMIFFPKVRGPPLNPKLTEFEPSPLMF